MPFLETQDHTTLFYKIWGTGKPVLFVSSWALTSEMWEYQMLPLSSQGFRCIAYDRRGHGRSDDPGCGYDFDTLADDLATLIGHLDLREVTLVGHSMGCAEIANYLARHGTDRIARVALVSPIRLIKMPDDPEAIFDAFRDVAAANMLKDRPLYMTDGSVKFFAVGMQWPQPPGMSREMVDWGINMILQASPKATIELWHAMADFTPDMRIFTMPTLVIHGDNDQNAPLDFCGRRISEAIPGSQLMIYERAPHGLFLTDRERLAQDLLAFARG